MILTLRDLAIIFVCKQWYKFGLDATLWNEMAIKFIPKKYPLIIDKNMPSIKHEFVNAYFKIHPNRYETYFYLFIKTDF